MRARILVPNSMPLTLYLRLNACALLLLVCSSSISCLDNKSEDCFNTCGEFHYSYPFGEIGSGCGDPDFQVFCDKSHPLLNISGHKYSILDYIANDKNIKIVNDNFCDLSGNSASISSWPKNVFRIASGYTILTFWRDCNQSFNNRYESTLSLCGNDWSYSVDPDIDSAWRPFCKTYLEIPIDSSYLSPSSINEKLLSQGFEITWQVDPTKEKTCDVCLESKGSCGYNISAPARFLCHCPDNRTDADKCPGDGPPDSSIRKDTGGRNKPIIIGCSIGGAALIAIAVVLFLRFYAKRTKTLSRGLASGDMEAAILPRREIGNLPIFSYEELRQATNCFHEENELGDGGFGSVYLGKLRDGRTVAVKRLYQDNSRRLEQFINEVRIFSTLNHPRVVRLYGCTSAESPELLLVYEFVSNGTLADHLHGDRRGPRGLPWDARLNIANQTAEALAFLHSVDPPIFHRDVKSSNILLDENFDVKVADFGLCRLVPVNASHVTTAPQGTPGYVDPEYHQCYQLTEKSDVYSFGVVLVEIISAKLAVDINRNRREISLANMAKSKIQEGALHELVDPQLEIEMNHEVKVTVTAVAELALRCLGSERDDRPHMKEVVAQLSEIRQSWDTSTGAGEQQWGSFSNIKQPISPISVQDQWSSISSTPNTSA